MRASIIIASVFAAFAAAAPVESPAAVEIEARQDVNTQVVRNVRVQLSQDATDTAVQANIAGNNAKISIQANFGGLGNPVKANRALVVGSSKGSCKIFKDAAGKQLVATIKSGGPDANFGNTNLGKGVIVCQ